MTTTEENYIKEIFKLNPTANLTVSTNEIAAAMQTSAASVTDMVKRLSEKGYVIYAKYKGAKLSPNGLIKAKQLIRNHRLWEVFLVDKLNFSWDEVHEVAEQLEHVKSDRLIEQLDLFLNFPKFDPHGDPIPDADGNIKLRSQDLLANITEGKKCVLLGVRDTSKEFLQFLDSLNITLGSEFEILQNFSYDKSKKIKTAEGQTHTFSSQVNNNLFVKEI